MIVLFSALLWDSDGDERDCALLGGQHDSAHLAVFSIDVLCQ